MPDTAQPATDPRSHADAATTASVREEAAQALQRSLDHRGQGGS